MNLQQVCVACKAQHPMQPSVTCADCRPLALAPSKQGLELWHWMETQECVSVWHVEGATTSEIWGKICTLWEWSIYMKYLRWHLTAKVSESHESLEIWNWFWWHFWVSLGPRVFPGATPVVFYLNGALSGKWYNNGWRSTRPKQCSQELWRWAAEPMEPTIRHPSNGTLLPFAVPWVPSLIILQSSYLIFLPNWTIMDNLR